MSHREFGGQFVEPFPASGDEDDVGATRSDLAGELCSDAGAGTGDEGGLACAARKVVAAGEGDAVSRLGSCSP
ncbi:hypothetical protein ACFYOY_33275 [Streptomyces sp. NPDC007875]|uniref:hypothetical protein n=1 Tax=Streptomyces sp. NPDC007875 TaxID=3364783 RepID=UPI0036965FBA